MRIFDEIRRTNKSFNDLKKQNSLKITLMSYTCSPDENDLKINLKLLTENESEIGRIYHELERALRSLQSTSAS